MDVEPETRRQIRMAAASKDETIKEFLERAILRELKLNPDGSGKQTAEWEQEFYPAQGEKPAGLADAPRPKSGRSVAEAVIEDRR